MRYLLTLTILLTLSVGCFAQGGPVQDSLREARMRQVMEMMREREQGRGAAGQPVQQAQPNTPVHPAALQPGIPTQAVTAPDPPSATERLETIRRKLDLLAETDANFAKDVEELSVSGLPLAELLRNIAKVYDVNISVKGAEGVAVTSNFTHARITDLLYFLCKEYNLDIDVTGNIVSVFPVPPSAPRPKTIDVKPGDAPGTVSYDLENDRLSDVMRLITSVGRVNFIIPNNLNGKTLSGHGRDMAIDDAVLAIASANGLRARKNNIGIWELAENTGEGSYRRESAFNEDQLYVDSLGMITAQIANGDVQQIITDLCETQGLNYFFVSPVSHTVPLNVKEVTFEALLGVMFAGTQFGWYLEDGIYLFGTFSEETLNSVRVVPLNYRSVAKLEEVIPTQLKTGLELKTFVDLNAIIASGDQRRVLRLENFLRSIDRRVPLVTIEVMIMDVTKTDLMEAGLGLGIGTAPTTTSGTLSPGVDMKLGAGSINSIIGRFNGFGSLNLGKVTPQFYMDIKMLEDNGTVQMHSTPKLSTLNGNPATLTSGDKTYYKEVQTNYWGSQTPTPSESYVWKEIEANLELKITPFVSADGLITLDIEITQSEFTDRVGDEKDEGPMGMASRSFKSTIRVQDGEMVLLGGIDRNSKNVSSTGLPFIARVPVLNWIFGKSKREKRDHQLNVFITPTLVE